MAASIENESCGVQNNQHDEVLPDFSDLDVFDDDSKINVKRPTCDRCKRPLTVCWCPFLPHEPFEISSNIYILQHPFEESRCLRTVPILENSVKPEKCRVFRGKRFSESKFPELASLLSSPETILLYPGPNAIDISTLPTDKTYNLVVIDGTWAQAKGIYTQNLMLKSLRKVELKVEMKSKYVIRTQPQDTSLSTLESTALAIAILERRPEIFEALTQPLVALCDFQIQHGATEHQSREYRVENGLWTKKLPRATEKRLAKKFAGEQSQGKS